jgi:hypothetical protein
MIYKLSAKAKKRLLKLRDLLLKDARRKNGIKFDMFDWGTSKTPEPKMDCGTQACALGLAAISGEFKRQGLDFRVFNHEPDDSDEYGLDITLHGVTNDNFFIGAKVFDIPYELSQVLFSPSGQNTQGAVAERELAKHIASIVKTGEW